MRFMRTATVVGTALLIGGYAPAAFADATLTPPVVDQTASFSNITINASNIPSNFGSTVNIMQCWRTGDAVGFDPLLDCANSAADSEIQVGGAFTKVFQVFNGDEATFGEWGCGPLASAAVTSQTCFIRLSGDLGTSNDEFYPFTYGAVVGPTTTVVAPTTTTVTPPPDVPEAPLSILLPGTAAVLAGAGIFIARRRQPKTSV